MAGLSQQQLVTFRDRARAATHGRDERCRDPGRREASGRAGNRSVYRLLGRRPPLPRRTGHVLPRRCRRCRGGCDRGPRSSGRRSSRGWPVLVIEDKAALRPGDATGGERPAVADEVSIGQVTDGALVHPANVVVRRCVCRGCAVPRACLSRASTSSAPRWSADCPDFTPFGKRFANGPWPGSFRLYACAT